MILALLLAGLCWGQDTAYPTRASMVIRDCTPFEVTVTKDPNLETPAEKEIHAIVLDTARIGGGAVLDLWATEYALKNGAREANPLGFNAPARIALKGALAISGILGCHELRKHGHPTWAKWTARGLMLMQVGFAINNVVQAHR